MKNMAVSGKYRQRTVRRTLFELMLILITAFYLYPLYAVVILALKSPAQALFNPMAFPTSLHLTNFSEAWKLMRFPRVFLNSLTVSSLSVVGISFIAAMAAFTLGRRKSRLYTILYYVFISGLLVPFYMTLPALMKLMRDLHLINSLIGLVFAYLGRGLPFAIFLCVGFIRVLPQEILDSGTIDGCSPFQKFWMLVLPMVKHITTTLIILNVLWIWNDFLFPMLTLTAKQYHTIPVAQYVFYGMYNSSWNLAFASYVLSMLPLLITYFFLQRYIVEGVTAGAIKG